MSKKINDRINNRPIFTGRKFSKPSLTIPGQSVTPQELYRSWVKGEPLPPQVFLDSPEFDRINKMHVLDKLDMAMDVKQEQKDLEKTIEEIKLSAKKQKVKEAEEKLRTQIIEELKAKNVTTSNDDAK